MNVPILSHFQARIILNAMQRKESRVEVSLDLGVTTTPLLIDALGVMLPDGQKVSFKQLKKIMKNPQKCYFVVDSELEAINVFSESTGWMRTLYPTKGAPTTLVSGFLMHRIKGTDPLSVAKGMVSSLGKLKGGEYLDSCMGLGYVAIELGKFGKVKTVEIDPGAIELAKLNPYSTPLFMNSNIEIKVGDIKEVIDHFRDNYFNAILHDPPSFLIADSLYSLDFYNKLYRVLKNNGVLFHYVGDPDSKLGSTITRGVVERLKDAGFRNIRHHKEAFGVSGIK